MYAIYKGDLCVARTSNPADVEFYTRVGYRVVNL